MSTAATILSRLTFRYTFLMWTMAAAFSVGIGLVCYSVLSFFISFPICLALSFVLALVALIAYVQFCKVLTIDQLRIAYFLNQRYPELEESADLILADEQTLTTLSLLQKNKINRILEKIVSTIKLPVPWKVPIITLFIGSILTAFFQQSVMRSTLVSEKNDFTSVDTNLVDKFASLKSSTISIIPPGYSGLKEVRQQTAEIKALEGSVLRWELSFNEKVKRVRFIFSGADTIEAKLHHDLYTFNKTLTASAFYQIQWQSRDSIITTGFFPIEMINDQVPVIDVKGLSQFTTIGLEEKQIIEVQATLTDDFGLTDAFINATVSKGSGESVKFREEKIRFSTPGSIKGKSLAAQRALNLKQLGLEPGDELYFYIETFDNKMPEGNRARTETFFIALQDTSQVESVADEGLGVDLMPEYFRSQRQIIIDSEKLLAIQKNMSKQDFDAKSNELGYDQKVLRLRYGQFLGEEFETNIGPGGHVQEEDHEHEEGEHDDEEDVTKTFGHQHDTENEHNLVPAVPQTPAHDHEPAKDGKEENPFEEFVHQHDNAEEATFFIQSVRVKLKAALTLMWDAELHLRLSDPAKSLPYQYKILKLLKEISNDSRIYVHRTGFDPPPLKEEKRLTADLSEIKSATNYNAYEQSPKYVHIQQAIQILQVVTEKPLSANEKTIMARAGSEVAPLAIEQPGIHLKTLSNLKTLSESTISVEAALKHETLQQLWKLIPPEPLRPSKVIQSSFYWDQDFFKELEKVK